MRVSRAEKLKSRDRIVAGAARLLRERGLSGASLADVMNEAGLTHGGFYRHFATREALVGAALDQAFDQMLSGLEAEARAAEEGASAAALASFVRNYLSEGHLANPGRGCPIPSLAGDVGRADDEVRARFSAGLRRMVSAIAGCLEGAEARRRARACRQLAMMAGAVAIARAADPDLAAEVLAACGAQRSSRSPGPAKSVGASPPPGKRVTRLARL